MNLKKNISHYSRFTGAPWFDSISNSKIMIFGQGGIGSYLTFFLARTGATIITIDMDTVEEGNISGQLYGKEDIGKKKVIATSDVITRLCGDNLITPLDIEVKDDESQQWYSLLSMMDVVCVSFDNIPMRKLVYEKWRKNGKPDSIYIDGRMSLESGNVFAIPFNSSKAIFEHYESTFWGDDELEELPCSAKATSHCGAFIASLMTSQITNWFTNQNPEVMPRSLITQLDFCLPLVLFEQPEIKIEYGTVD